jgi:hypothetical protein
VAIEIEQIEGIQARLRCEALPTSSAKRPLERSEIGCAALIEHDRFPVENGAIQAQLANVMSDGRKSCGPIMSAPCDYANAAPLNMDSKAIAVPLHLESPIVPHWRLALKLRQAGLNTIRHLVG